MTTLNEELSLLLNTVCEGRQADSAAALVHLEDCLLKNKEILINLLEDKPKKDEDRKTLISGKAVIEGQEHRLNEDFIKQTLFLSDHLNVNEFTAARLLLAGISQAQTTNSTPLDTAVYLYHNERGFILATLNTILEAAKDCSIQEPVRNVYTQFAASVVNSNGSFVKRAIESTKNISIMTNALLKQGMLDSAKDCKQQILTQLQTQYAQQAQDGTLQSSIQNLNFGANTTELRLEKLNDERIFLAQILYHISSLFWLKEEDLLEILTKVQSINLSDSVAAYMLTALLASLSLNNGYTRQGVDFSKNDTILKKLHEQITKKTWKVDSVEAVVHIQWALFINTVEKQSVLNINTKNIVKSAIASDAFGFMNDYLLYFKQKEGDSVEEKKGTVGSTHNDDSAMAVDGLIVDPNDYKRFNVDINPDFRKFVEHELELLTESFIYNMFDIITDLHTKAHDEQLLQINESTEEVKNTIVKFFTLLASVYKDRLDAGLKFWNNQNTELYNLMFFVVHCKLSQCYASMFDFLGSISIGVDSADQAHKALRSGTDKNDIHSSNLFSWGKLFGTLQHYIAQFEKIKTEDNKPPNISVEDEEALCKYLYLCQQVVQYSSTARKDIWADTLLAPHQSIVQMISSPTSTRLRASLYDLLTAFCSNWGGGAEGLGKNIALQVWDTLEKSDMIIPKKVMTEQPTEAVKATPTVTPPSNTLFSGSIHTPAVKTSTVKPQPPKQKYFLPEQPSGFLREFEEEKASQFFTETYSVLNLFASLIHTPSKRDVLLSGFSVIQPSIPRLLGSDNNRTPGTAPYVSFVIDHIFLALKNLRYHSREIRWRLTDACLAIIENSIASFNIGPLVDKIGYMNKDTKRSYTSIANGLHTPAETAASASVIQTALLDIITQPGYDIMIRILSGGGLIHEMFKIVEKGKEGIHKSINKHKHTYYKNCMTRCLRIFSQVFNIQNAFVNVVLPQLNKSAERQNVGLFKLGNFTFPSPPPSLRSLANLMLNNTKVIEQIALMVNCDEYEDICKLSINILSELASPPQNDAVKFPDHINVPMGGIGSSLAGILLSSPNASSVIFSFRERLEIDSAEILTYEDYEYDMNAIPFWLAERTLSNIYRLDDTDQPCPTISVRLTILDMLLKNMTKDVKSPTITEFILGYDVNELESTGIQQKSIPTDVRHKYQLACFLSILDMLSKGTNQQNQGEGLYVDSLIRSHPVLAEKCYQLMFQLCARESTSTATLHYLRNNTNNFLIEQFKLIAHRLETTVGVSQPYFRGTLLSADKVPIQTDFFTMVSCLHQRAWLLKLIALELHNNSTDHSSISNLLQLLYQCSDDFITENDDRRLEDLKFKLDTNYQQSPWSMLEIVNSLEFTWVDGMTVDEAAPAKYLASFKPDEYVIEKGGYKIYDIRTIYKILRQYELFDPACQALPEEERVIMEVEMRDILTRLMAENRHREISHARLHCLRAWKQVLQVTIDDRFDLLSYEAREKIIYDLLSYLLPKLEKNNGFNVEIRNGLADVSLSLMIRLKEDKRKQSILRLTTTSESRLPHEKLNFLFISIVKCICNENATVEVRSAMYTALANLLHYIKSDNENENIVNGDIRAQFIKLMGGERIEQLLTIICTDATKGVAMNRTTSFMALEVLYLLIVENKSNVLHTYLVKKNFLQNVIGSVSRSDNELYKVIQERDASLIPLYNHEAKFSLFMQIASSREGAGLLLSNDLMNNINGCKFINTRFERNQIEDPDTAYKVERHARMITPVLELVNAVVESIGSEFSDQYAFTSWVKKQEAFVHILKDENTSTTLSALYILHLTTSLLYQLSCQAHYFDDIENNGLEELDALMIKLIPKYCLPRDWATVIRPVGLEEVQMASVPDLNAAEGQTSLLVLKAEKHISNIRKNLLAYARSSTFRSYAPGKRTFKPVIANTLASIKDQDIALSRVSLMTPSLTTLVSCLADTGKKLSKAHADQSLLCSQKDNVASLKYEEMQEIANTAIPKGLDIKFERLNQSQQSYLLETEIDRRINLKYKDIRDLIFILENVLIILWRHLDFYLNRSSISIRATLSPCERQEDEQVILQHQLLYQTNVSLIAKLKVACEKDLDPVLTRLETVLATTSTPSVMVARIRRCYE